MPNMHYFEKKITKKDLEFFHGLYQVLLLFRIKNCNEKNINLNLVETKFPQKCEFCDILLCMIWHNIFR